jgi:PIN domain nuclease of toxin-antitoxin system
MICYLDSMVVAYLLDPEELHRLTPAALEAINQSTRLLVSPMVLFELKGVIRKKKLLVKPESMLSDLTCQLGVQVCDLPFPRVALTAASITWTREYGDAFIVAQALTNNHAALVTSDRNIREHYPPAIW